MNPTPVAITAPAPRYPDLWINVNGWGRTYPDFLESLYGPLGSLAESVAPWTSLPPDVLVRCPDASPPVIALMGSAGTSMPVLPRTESRAVAQEANPNGVPRLTATRKAMLRHSIQVRRRREELAEELRALDFDED
jgi:hypothetical protein